jgi:hypothetical protein
VIRFALTTAATVLLVKYVFASFSLARLRIVHLIAWTIFYTWYFWQFAYG